MTAPELPPAPVPTPESTGPSRIDRLVDSLTSWQKLLVAIGGLILAAAGVWGAIHSFDGPAAGHSSTPTPTNTFPSPTSQNYVANRPIIKFDDFRGATTAWWPAGCDVARVEQGADAVLEFTPLAQSAAEASRDIHAAALAGSDAITLRINLHGATLSGGDASALYLDQGGSWKFAELSAHVTQGQDGWQNVTVPLSDFRDPKTNVLFDKTAAVDRIGFRFWNPAPSGAKSFTIDVTDISFGK
jgi:hypothetical protein